MALDRTWKTSTTLDLYHSDTFLPIPATKRAELKAHMASNGGQGVRLKVTMGDAVEYMTVWYVDDDVVRVRRGTNNTEPRFWNVGACVCYDQDVPACEAEPSECDPCRPPNPWDRVTVGTGLAIDRTDPANPVLDVSRTNVAGTYGGARVDEYGRFTFIPPGWPASALPLYDPCACGDAAGGGGSSVTTATEVQYTNCGFTTADNVQDALCQLEQWASGLAFDAGVLKVSVGDGLIDTGTLSHPVISLKPTGITPGTYAGFEVNQFGQITGYSAQAVDHPGHAAALPLQVEYDPGSNTWNHSVQWANYQRPGVVQLVDFADVTANTVSSTQEEWPVSYETVKWMIQNIDAPDIKEFAIKPLPTASVSVDDFLAIHENDSDSLRKIQVGDIVSLVSTRPIAALEYNPATQTMPVRENISTVVKVSSGVYEVHLNLAGDFVVFGQIIGDHPLSSLSIRRTSNTVLYVSIQEMSVDNGALNLVHVDRAFWLLAIQTL